MSAGATVPAGGGGSRRKGITGVDGSMKRLLVNFSQAVFLAQPPPRDIHKFAEEHFTRSWNRAKVNMPSIGTEVVQFKSLCRQQRLDFVLTAAATRCP